MSAPEQLANGNGDKKMAIRRSSAEQIRPFRHLSISSPAATRPVSQINFRRTKLTLALKRFA
jgi:hypothetical protein